MIRIVVLSFALLAGCCQNAMMTQERFADIQVGTCVDDLKACVGSPYEVTCCEDGEEEYIYIERIETGRRSATQYEYVLRVCNGQVIGKEFRCPEHKDDLINAYFD